MIMGSDERAACATFAHRQRDQRRSAKRLYRLAAAQPGEGSRLPGNNDSRRHQK